MKTPLGDELREEVVRFTAERDLRLDIDHFLAYDIHQNMAHAVMQHREGSLKDWELREILRGLREILEEYPEIKGIDFLGQGIEDGHTLIEHLLHDKIGDVGLKIHFNRSRNDQVVTVQRMKLREDIIDLGLELLRLCETLLEGAECEKETLMPAFTHLQPAQPTTLGHYYLSKCEEALRDVKDLKNLFDKVNVSPLGACALAGAPRIDGVGVDRSMTAALLGFDAVHENTMDAVSSRGEFVLDLLSVLNVMATLHFSRVCEDLSVWSSWGIINLGEEYTTSSSVMPQKKNPDVAELIRAKSATMLGNLMKLSTIFKGTPTGYNRDMQEVKPILVESVEEAKSCIGMMRGMMGSIEVNRTKTRKILVDSLCTATDLANAIALRFDVPFRKAYLIVKGFVGGESLEEASMRVIERRIELKEEAMEEILDPLKSVLRRDCIGGPSPRAVSKGIEGCWKDIGDLREWFERKGEKIGIAMSNLRNHQVF
jgi:argininosuccinate lyase